MDFEPVIGLEIHARLLTQTKIFCGCSVTFGAPANSHVCPVCMGLPGALPALNKRAVEHAIKASLAFGCKINQTSIFARKNYFYPDLPKGYQISQYEQPVASKGLLEYGFGAVQRRIGIVRVHLEEDAGKSLHSGFPDSDRKTYLDFNRSGVPLVEIVTEPEMNSAADAARCFERLRSVLMAVGVNDGNMEEGSLRCDANISVRRVGEQALGVKVEIKNINSFRFLQRALEYEFERQIIVLQGGGVILQETRLWDAEDGRTYSMRTKEEAHDYRYFPEPDLPPLRISSEWIEEIRATLPELPEVRRKRFVEDYGLPENDALLLTQSRELADFFELTATVTKNAKASSNWIMGELMRKLNEQGISVAESSLSPYDLAGLIKLVDAGTITIPIAKVVFDKLYASGRSAESIVQEEGLGQIDDEVELERIVIETIRCNLKAAEQYRAGKTTTLGFLVGQVMKATGGTANPKLVNNLLKRLLHDQTLE